MKAFLLVVSTLMFFLNFAQADILKTPPRVFQNIETGLDFTTDSEMAILCEQYLEQYIPDMSNYSLKYFLKNVTSKEKPGIRNYTIILKDKKFQNHVVTCGVIETKDEDKNRRLNISFIIWDNKEIPKDYKYEIVK